MGKRSAVVFGATGLVGQSLVRQLCEQEDYISVVAIGRKALDFTHKKLEQKVHSLDELTESDIRYAQDVFCCLGTTMKKAGSKKQFEKVDFEYPMSIASLAKNQGVEHFICISAMGASEKSIAYYSRVKGKLEMDLIKLQFPRLSIIRPSLLTGNRTEFRFGEKVGEKVLNVLGPLLVGGLKKYRSIEASQVAAAMIAIALSEDKTPVKIYKSNELAALRIRKLEEKEGRVDKEAVFNWNKMKDEQTVLDEEVTFDRSKIKTVDRDAE